MIKHTILITSPSLDTRQNVSGISSVTSFIINNNSRFKYEHFELGRKDNEKRGLAWFFKMVQTTVRWIFVVSSPRIALVHFNFAFSKPSVLRDAPLIFYTKIIRKRMVIHVHGGEYLLKTSPPVWMNFLLKGIFSAKARVLVLSTAEKKVLTALFSVRDITILPNCTDLSAAAEVFRPFTGRKLNLLFLGRIHADKGIENIYQGLMLLKEKGLPFHFFMAGKGPQEQEYVGKFSVLLGSDFTFCGVVSGDAKNSLLASCDVFLLPSLYEGLPMSLIESMSFGLVPVVTDIGSIGSVVKNGENGIMLGKDLASEIAGAVEFLSAGNGILKKMSSHARASIFNDFDPEKYIFCLNEIYDIA